MVVSAIITEYLFQRADIDCALYKVDDRINRGAHSPPLLNRQENRKRSLRARLACQRQKDRLGSSFEEDL
jgi:hypothetical protein